MSRNISKSTKTMDATNVYDAMHALGLRQFSHGTVVLWHGTVITKVRCSATLSKMYVTVITTSSFLGAPS